MSISDWPKTEQPREKLLHNNPATLSDAEILAIFLRTGSAGKSAVDLARELLDRFKGLRGILEADMASFCQAKGLGTAKYVQLQAALELGRRYLQSKLSREHALNDPKDTAAFLKSRLCGYQHEVFACLFLDNRHRLICFEELFTGTIDGASVYPREVVKRALFHNAAALILAHNHPSGIAEPSQADQNITQQLKKSLALVDIRVLDHFVIGENEPISFAERGLI
jgi:DNA repair protein RadC